MARVYVGAKFEAVEAARELMSVLRAAGHEITHDWTGESVEGKRGVEVLDVLRDAALDDADGVKSADAMVLLHHPNLRGGLVEMGIALGRDIPVIVVGGAGEAYPPIFYWHPDVIHVATPREALAHLGALFPGEQVVGAPLNVLELLMCAPRPCASGDCRNCTALEGA